ncbi:MAG: hypothetical protein AB1Z63_01605 [Candidatus Limnocylindrales bacterium]
MRRRALFALDVAAKAALVALLLHALLNPDLPQYADKAMQWRVLTYPLAVMAIPLAWWLRWRGRPFPVVSDLLFTLAFLIDTVGNALDLYDTIVWWDDLNHFGNWVLLAAAFVALGWPARASKLTRVALGVGFGAVAAIVWEAFEYVTFVPGSPEAATAYQDTLGDLVLGLLGALVGASIAAWLVDHGRARKRPDRRGHGAVT